MTIPVHESARQKLLEQGCCVFPGVLDRPLLDELLAVTDGMLDDYSRADAEKFRYQGSNISLGYQQPVFPRLFAWPAALDCLARLGFNDPRWWSAFLLSKPPHAPPLYWHQDWWAWDDPCSGEETPPQVFLMYYLTDTSPKNGCLRVIPGTHRRRIPLHDRLPDAHTDAAYGAALDAESPLFKRHPDEVDIAVKAGDLVIGDARLLHAAHANDTDRRRSCLTLWYLPAFARLPDAIKAFATRSRQLPPPELTSTPDGMRMLRLLADFEGEAEPPVWNRTPGRYLRP